MVSCSFTKGKKEKPKKIERPSIILNDSTYTVNSINEDRIIFTAKYLEVYDKRNTAKLEDLTFNQFDKEGNLILKGSCDLANIETERKDVVLNGNIKFHHIKEKMSLEGQTLKWSTDLKKLETNKNDELKLSYKDDISLTGKGFTGDLNTLDFTFYSSINGEINEKTSNNN